MRKNIVARRVMDIHARTASLDESVVTSDGTVEEVNQTCYLGDMLDGGGDRGAIWASWGEGGQICCPKMVTKVNKRPQETCFHKHSAWIV